ncbi:MAG: hypothetical protein CL428_10525 [Acidimicrobiaceae bacterium]|nr:hypothetical protein [Acidimicrobiaceae bacterium]|tara:strand:- start:612 stop:1268 length:657 start_codon:yes stop_codon:yes gene_type:complete
MVTGHFQEYEDEYLETLYEFHERAPGARVRNGELANYLDVSPASATEMVQRLAKNGFVDYVPYKGTCLTEKGLEHGMMMKRRHRLAEVLLTKLPFEGDVHETACRLEHAFNDDLELCISLLLGNPKLDPSGRNIPPANSRIAHKLEAEPVLSSLASFETSKEGEIVLILTTSVEREILEQCGVKIGGIVTTKDGEYWCDGEPLQIADYLAEKIILRCI